MTGRFASRGALFLLALGLLSGAPSSAGETPDEIYEAAGRAFQAGRKCVRNSRKAGVNQFVENEKAIGHLEQGQRLLEQYLALRPDDAEAESVMVDLLALLFWCHKMSPMVDPEDTEPEDPEPEDPEPEDPDPDQGGGQAGPSDKGPRQDKEAQPSDEDEAARLLEEAQAYRGANPKDRMGALARFFFIAERYGQTAAGAEASATAEELQAKLFTVKPVVPAKRKRSEPLTDKDAKAIEKRLRAWLSNRRKIRCASCSGEGFSECKKCGGRGKIRGRAGRTSTCSKCKRGKMYCKRRSCAEGIDTRVLSKVVLDARAPYYREKLKALLGGGGKKSLQSFIHALAATLSGSPRAPAEVSRRAVEMGIAPVQLRDIISAHGPGAQVLTPFTGYSLGAVGRRTAYELKGARRQAEAVTCERTPDGKWHVRTFK